MFLRFRPLLWIWLVLGMVLMVVLTILGGAARGQGFLDTGGWRVGAGIGIGGDCYRGGCVGGCCPLPTAPPPLRRDTVPQARARPQSASPVVVKIVSTRRPIQKHGSGSMVGWRDGRGLVLTVAHILQAGYTPAIRFSDGAELPATIVAADALHDCALLEVRVPVRTCIRMAAGPPQSGAVSWAGYGGNGYAGSGGRVLGVDGDFLKIDGEAREGDSGAPIWGVDGGLVAILSDGMQVPGEPWVVSGPHVGWIRQFIAAHWPADPGPLPLPGPEPPPLPLPNHNADPSPLPGPAAPPLVMVGPGVSELADLRAEVAALRKAIEALSLTPGPPGPRGAPGVVPVQAPWYLRTVNPATGEERITEIFPGDTVTLKLFEYPKP